MQIIKYVPFFKYSLFCVYFFLSFFVSVSNSAMSCIQNTEMNAITENDKTVML